MEPEIRLVHWYDTERHHIPCGASTQTNSTKHARGVTCGPCLTAAAEARGARGAAGKTGDRVIDLW